MLGKNKNTNGAKKEDSFHSKDSTEEPSISNIEAALINRELDPDSPFSAMEINDHFFEN